MNKTIELFFEQRNVEILLEENELLRKRLIHLEHDLNHTKMKYEITFQRMISASIG